VLDLHLAEDGGDDLILEISRLPKSARKSRGAFCSSGSSAATSRIVIVPSRARRWRLGRARGARRELVAGGFAYTCTVRMNMMKSVRAIFALAPRGCTIVGTPGNDVLVGTAGAEVICAVAGDDIVRGGRGNDVIRLGAGGDIAYGQRGSDRLVGGDGGDRLNGGRRPDALLGGRGSDVLKARDCLRDIVKGGRGVDRARVDRIDRLTSIEKRF
jgi:hypothetical protein